MPNSDGESHLTIAELNARGWNQRLVDRFLGEPDSYSNPGLKAGPCPAICAGTGA